MCFTHSVAVCHGDVTYTVTTNALTMAFNGGETFIDSSGSSAMTLRFYLYLQGASSQFTGGFFILKSNFKELSVKSMPVAKADMFLRTYYAENQTDKTCFLQWAKYAQNSLGHNYSCSSKTQTST